MHLGVSGVVSELLLNLPSGQFLPSVCQVQKNRDKVGVGLPMCVDFRPVLTIRSAHPAGVAFA